MADSVAEAGAAPPALRARGLAKRYGDVVAVDGLDLEVRGGECFGLLGPNGAGKTTTIEILEGLLAPDAGSVEVLGLTWAADAQQIRERIGIQLQETRLNEKLSVEETVRLFRSFFRNGRTVDEVLALVELGSKRRSWVGKLSGGQRQRLAVACALVNHPDLLFLDEPTTGLDPQSRRQLWDVLRRFRERGGAILLTTHYMDEAETLADRVAIVDRGRIIALGTPRDLVASLGAEHIVEFAVGGGAEGSGDVAESRLRALPGVRDVRRGDGSISLVSAGPHLTIPALLSEIDRERLALTLLATHHATLEDVFVALTGRHLRDD